MSPVSVCGCWADAVPQSKKRINPAAVFKRLKLFVIFIGLKSNRTAKSCSKSCWQFGKKSSQSDSHLTSVRCRLVVGYFGNRLNGFLFRSDANFHLAESQGENERRSLFGKSSAHSFNPLNKKRADTWCPPSLFTKSFPYRAAISTRCGFSLLCASLYSCAAFFSAPEVNSCLPLSASTQTCERKYWSPY